MTSSETRIDETDRTRRQLVTFLLGAEHYGVDIASIREVIHHREVMVVPNAPDFVEGVLDLRQSVIPVVDLKRRLRISEPARGRRRILVLEHGDRPLGVIVDDISRVIWVTTSQCEPLPDAVVDDASRNCISALARTEDGLVIIMDPNRILSGAETEALGQLASELGGEA